MRTTCLGIYLKQFVIGKNYFVSFFFTNIMVYALEIHISSVHKGIIYCDVFQKQIETLLRSFVLSRQRRCYINYYYYYYCNLDDD